MISNIDLMEILDDQQSLIVYVPEKKVSILCQLNRASGSNNGDFILMVKVLGAKEMNEDNEKTKTKGVQFKAKPRST